MKSLLKENFPINRGFLKKLYHSTNLYKSKLKKIKEEKENLIKTQVANETAVMIDIFDNEFMVFNGPFNGMKYINKSSCSTLLPKILGSYEEPIHDWIMEVIVGKKYNTILDIGSAEGYYAVGFALKLPETRIIAYDIDEDARRNLKQLMQVNHVNDIEIKAECTHEELNSKCKLETLIFCDIEGFENILLDPQKIPGLKFVDILVEAHDFIIPNITNNLIDKFYKTHSMKIIIDYPFRLKKYITPKKMSEEQYVYITNELRPDKMKWIFMKSNYAQL